MRSKNTAMKLACILGSFVFLMAIVAYAVSFSAGNDYNPSGGFGPPITADFEWNWTVNNDLSYPISATANPTSTHFIRHRSWLPDDTEYTLDPSPITNSSIPAGTVWDDDTSASCSVMVSGNKYYWKWDSWTVQAAGSSGSGSGGKGGQYNCF